MKRPATSRSRSGRGLEARRAPELHGAALGFASSGPRVYCGLARRRGSSLAAPGRPPFPATQAREAARERPGGGGTYQLLPDPAPHAPAVAVPIPQDAGAEWLQVEADQPEG